MDDATAKISLLQTFTILALMNGLANHVILNPMILDTSNRDSWITVLVAGAIFLPWSLLIVFMNRKSGRQNWRSWLAKQTHPAVSWLLMLPVCLLLYLIGALTVVHTVSWNITNYLPASSRLTLILPLIVICSILSVWGVRVIAITSGILLPIVIGLGIFVSVSNANVKDHKLLLPILEHGWTPVLNGLVYAGGGFIEIIVLLLLQHRISSKLRSWHILLYGLFTILITAGPIIGAITEFGPDEAAKQMISPYEQWRLVQIGQYVEHLDFFSIFQWMSGACVRISLAVYLFNELMPFKRIRSRNWTIAIIMISYAVLSLLPINEYMFYLAMYEYYIPISFYTILILSVVWTIVAIFAKTVREERA